MEDEKYSKELDVAVRVVHMACSLCQRVQKGLASMNSAQVKSKDDDSLVTIAGTTMFVLNTMFYYYVFLGFGSLYFGGCCLNEVFVQRGFFFFFGW